MTSKDDRLEGREGGGRKRVTLHETRNLTHPAEICTSTSAGRVNT